MKFRKREAQIQEMPEGRGYREKGRKREREKETEREKGKERKEGRERKREG